MLHRSLLAALLVLLVTGLAAISVADDDQPAPAAPVTGKDVGQIAPDFTLKDQAGNDVRLQDLRGKTVVLEWFNYECPIALRHYNKGTMKSLAGKWAEKNVVWLAINSTHTWTVEKNKAIAEKLGRTNILDDHAGAVGHLYAASRTPEMVVIDGDGKIRYRGAIDNDRFGREENPTNYVDQALTELADGKDVSVSTATPYGCTIKYAPSR